jgi:type VI secretion system secreted protein VgrG
VLTAVSLDASQGGDFRSGAVAGEEFDFRNHFECIPYSTPFRPARVTPRPVISGAQTAVVVGQSGEEIWTDKYGRVKVQFHWDRYGKADENSSCWIRVSEGWAGKNWGVIMLPRLGQEVVVSFLEGDPDQPLITGRVYNAEQMPPYDLPGEQTKSTLKSLSSKGGGGFNELRFEDKKGDEQVFIHAEKNLDIRVKNEAFETVEKDLHVIVQQNRFDHVENNRNEKVDQDAIINIGRDHHLKIDGKQAITIQGSRSLAVTGDVADKFDANHSESVGTAYYLKASQIVIEAAMGMTLKCGGNSVVIDPSGVTLTAPMITIDGSMVRIASGPGSPAMSGTAGSLVPAAAAQLAFEADKADPGEMAEIKAQQSEQQQGKYGAVRLDPHKPDDDSGKKKKKHWIEIELFDEEGKPVAGEPYRITLPDGSTVAEGTLNEKGFARVDDIDPGTCKVTFPQLDKDTWGPK